MADGREKLIKKDQRVDNGCNSVLAAIINPQVFNRGVKCSTKVFLKIVSFEHKTSDPKKQYPSKEKALLVISQNSREQSLYIIPQSKAALKQVKNSTLLNIGFRDGINSTYPLHKIAGDVAFCSVPRQYNNY